MDDKVAAKLREPFKAGEIGKLPRVTCPKCSDRRVQCDEHSKAKCDVCKAYVSTRHIHIDYVGHADVTSRLLEADPGWNWEPKAEDEHGLPVFDTDDHGNPVGLWIRLTVGGVTRLGYGSAPSGQPDAVKVLIGDALRNAAMRFGVALDLWAKGDRADPTAENATASAGQATRRPSRRESAADAWENASPARPKDGHTWADRAVAIAVKLNSKPQARELFREAVTKEAAGEISAEDKERVCALVTARVAELDAEQAPDDPWLTEMASMSTREDAGPLLAKLEKARGVTVNEQRYKALKAGIVTKADSLPSAPGEAA